MIKFSKYHGLGNDFVIVHENVVKGYDYSQLSKKMCNRYTGIGADGFIIVSEKNGLEMIFYNSDGSRACMCGNGIRCFARFLYDNKICMEKSYEVKTLAGNMTININNVDSFNVTVNMGSPRFAPKDIPVLSNANEFINKEIIIDRNKYIISSVFMGTIHTVIFVDNLDKIDMSDIGSKIENHNLFPDRTNVNFVQVIDNENIKMQTFERGVGLTLACGTGACASVVIANKLNKTKRNVSVHLPLGKLNIKYEDRVYMSGPAEKIFDGYYYIGDVKNEII